jgi:hypothetical protein
MSAASCSESEGVRVLEFFADIFQLGIGNVFNYSVDSLELHLVKFEIKTSLIMLNSKHASGPIPCEDLDTVELDMRIFLIRELGSRQVLRPCHGSRPCSPRKYENCLLSHRFLLQSKHKHSHTNHIY